MGELRGHGDGSSRTGAIARAAGEAVLAIARVGRGSEDRKSSPDRPLGAPSRHTTRPPCSRRCRRRRREPRHPWRVWAPIRRGSSPSGRARARSRKAQPGWAGGRSGGGRSCICRPPPPFRRATLVPPDMSPGAAPHARALGEFSCPSRPGTPRREGSHLPLRISQPGPVRARSRKAHPGGAGGRGRGQRRPDHGGASAIATHRGPGRSAVAAPAPPGKGRRGSLTPADPRPSSPGPMGASGVRLRQTLHRWQPACR